MSNLTKSEQEINSYIYNKEKIFNKFFSFEEAEKQIQILKNNYIEIKNAKNKVTTVIELDNIKKYEETLYYVPKTFDDLSKAAFLILEDLKNYEQKNKKSLKESKNKSRKKYDLFLNNKVLFKTAHDTTISKGKNKNIYLFYDNGKKKDNSVKIKNVITFSENIEDINNNDFEDTNQKLSKVSNNQRHLTDNKRKSSEIKLIKNNNTANGVESSRYTPKSLKLPKIILNNDKEKKNTNFLSQYSDDIKRSVELHKSSNLSKKIYK